MPVGPIGMAAATGGINAGIDIFSNLIMGQHNDARQLKQQGKLNEQAYNQHRQTTEYNMQKQLEMWEKTGYKPTVAQMKAAGLNPAMMYGGSGAGGSTGIQTAGGAAGSAPNEAVRVNPTGAMAMGMELALLKAQKENIEADTATKKATEQNLAANTEGTGIENAFKSYMMSTSPEGKENVTIAESTRGKQEGENLKRTQTENKFRLEENERQALMNSKVMERIGAEITKLAQENKNLEEIYKNLQKQGLIMDAEIEWNKLDIEGGNVGKFLTNIIKMALKPR